MQLVAPFISSIHLFISLCLSLSLSLHCLNGNICSLPPSLPPTPGSNIYVVLQSQAGCGGGKAQDLIFGKCQYAE